MSRAHKECGRRHRREHTRGRAGQRFTFCWSGTGSRQRRDKSVKSAGGDTRMQGVRKRPGQRIGLEDAPPSTLPSAGAPCGRRTPNVTQANKEHERRDTNARGQKTSRPTHKSVRVTGSRIRANVPSIFRLQSKSRCGTGLSWP